VASDEVASISGPELIPGRTPEAIPIAQIPINGSGCWLVDEALFNGSLYKIECPRMGGSP
jgi:hypothetical protein